MQEKRRAWSKVHELEKHRALTPEQKLLKGAKRRASINNLEIDIELSDIKIPEVCPVLGIPLKGALGCAAVGSPTLDRIDNSKGYTKDNIAVVSHKINSHKANLSVEEVERLLKYMKKELN